jgi:hypothetical protein
MWRQGHPDMKELKQHDFPVNYQIQVQGNLSSWAGKLGALQISIVNDKRLGDVTILTGHVSDQAELLGILNTIYELHLTVLLVQALPTAQSSD